MIGKKPVWNVPAVGSPCGVLVPERRGDGKIRAGELAVLEAEELHDDVALVGSRLVGDHRDRAAARRHDRLAHPREPDQVPFAEPARMEVLRRTAPVNRHAHQVRNLHVIRAGSPVDRPEAARPLRLDVVDVLPVRRPGRHGGGAAVGELRWTVIGLDPDVARLRVGHRPQEQGLVRRRRRLGDDDHVGGRRRPCGSSVTGRAAVGPRATAKPERQLAVEQVDRDDRDDQQTDDRQHRREERPHDPEPVRIARAGRRLADRGRHAGTPARAVAGSAPSRAEVSGWLPEVATSRMSS